jgi:hypothetical protein
MFQKQIEYIFHHKGIVHVLQTKPSANSKLGIGMVMQTYHFSLDQVISVDFTQDKDNCRDCPMSYNQNGGKSGKCYTHTFQHRMGLMGMLKRLNRLYLIGAIKSINKDDFNNYLIISKAVKPTLLRLGAYGEAALLPLNIVGKLVKCAVTYTAYSHMWTKPEYKGYSKYFMASTHGYFETLVANSLGFRAFESAKTQDVTKMAMCPAAKEFSGNKKTCIECGACNGTHKQKTNNIFIKTH